LIPPPLDKCLAHVWRSLFKDQDKTAVGLHEPARVTVEEFHIRANLIENGGEGEGAERKENKQG
jgi:hypothetical protein